MSYKTQANYISRNKTIYDTSVSNIKTINFDSIWKGPAKDALTSALSKITTELENLSADLDTYVSALQELDSYKTKKERITELRNEYSSLPDKKIYNWKRKRLSSQISALVSENRELRKSIESKINSISSYTYETNIIENLTLELRRINTSLIVDINELLAKFQSNSLKQLGDGDSLYNYIPEEQVEQLMANIQRRYQGRYLAVNSALGIVDLAASNNIKLDYDWGGGHSTITTLKHVATGTDCSAFVSWAVNQGAPGDFITRSTAGFINTGKTIDYQNAKPGDILVYRANGEGHVIMIVKNDPETENFTVVEAAGQNVGVVVQNRDYSSLKSNHYEAKDMSELYQENPGVQQ